MEQKSTDFRDWDIAPQSSFDGVDASGFPFYLWRESADNRLTFGRPRYCCISPIDGELYFVFYHPSANVRIWEIVIVLFGTIAIMLYIGLDTTWFDKPTPRGPYLMDESLPPFLVAFRAILLALLAGPLAALAAFVVGTLVRWFGWRFSGEGVLYGKPLRLLSGFDKVPAAETDAKINGKKATTGHGLTAVFDDGSIIILTGSAWDYPSIVAQHRDLTNLFRIPRDEILAAWAECTKKSTPTPVSASGVAPGGIPERL